MAARTNELQRVVFQLSGELSEFKRKAAKAKTPKFMTGPAPPGRGLSAAQRQRRARGIKLEHIRQGARRG